MGGVYSLKRDLIRMRQSERIDLAKKEGKYLGRVTISMPGLTMQ